MTRPLTLCAALLVALAGCRSAAPTMSSDVADGPDAVTVFLVRHAETAPDGTRDPGLSDAGRQRAEALAETLRHDRVRAVYATEYRRTQETAAPIARREGVEVTVVPYGSGPLDAYVARLADQIRARLDAPDFEPAEGVVVVGHSNTIPALAEALTGTPVPPIAEDEYSRRIRLLVFRDRAVPLPDEPGGAR